MEKILIIGLGGGIGSVVRYLVSQWTVQRWGGTFPYGTLLVNVVGCLVIGFFMFLITERLIVHPYWRLLISVGFLGGLTTFSSFSYETLRLLQDAEYLLAMANVLTNCIVGFIATWLGIALARSL